MTRDQAAGLLRKPEHPQQATFLELFFDLVLVLSLNRLVDRLATDLMRPGVADRSFAMPEVGKTLLLLLPVAWVWTLTAWTTSRFNPQRLPIQAIVVGTMFGTLIMSAALPAAYGQHGLVFAVPYVIIQLGRSVCFAVLTRGNALQRVFAREVVWFGATGVLWVVGGLATGDARPVLWIVAAVGDYLGAIAGWPTPGLGRARATVWAYAGEHLADRYRQFLIVALGESILVLGAAYVTRTFVPARSTALTLAFATTVLLWRIYFYRAGQILALAVAWAKDPIDLGRVAAYAHLAMITGIVGAAAGYELVIENPTGPPKPAWTMLILAGPAFFLAGRARFEHIVFGRVSPSRLVGIIVLVALLPILIHLPPLVASATAVLVLLGIATADALRARGQPLEDPAPPL